MSEQGFTRAASMQLLRQAAAAGDFLEVKRLCREKGIDVDQPGPESGMTALHRAVIAPVNSNKIVSFLIKAKFALVDALDAYENTPLNLCIQVPHVSLGQKLEVINTLLVHLADPTKQNIFHLTPLMNLIRLRDSFPPDCIHQRRGVDALIPRIKENAIIAAHERGEPMWIDSRGLVVPDPRAYNVPQPTAKSHYYSQPGPEPLRFDPRYPAA